MLDGGWEFIVSVAVARKENGRQDREMGESTRQMAEAHTGTYGRKKVEEARLTAGKGSSVGAVGRTKEWRAGQKAKNAPGRTRGMNKTTVGNSWSQPPRSFSLNSNFLRARPAGPKQAGEAWTRGDKARSTFEVGLQASKHVRRAQSSRKPSPQSEFDVGWKRGVSLKGPIRLLGQDLGGNQAFFAKGPLHSVDLSAKGKAKVDSEDSEAQLKGSALKCGSKKLWNALLPPSPGCQQGGRSRSEPLTIERSLSVSDALPMEDDSKAGTKLDQCFSASPRHSSGF